MSILCFSIDIWIIGSSIIKNAFCHARMTASMRLGLTGNVDVWWQGYSGMRLLDLIPKIQLLLNIKGNRPNIIIVHVGGNDIGRLPINELMRDYLKTLDALTTMLPGVKIGLSQILPRTAWRFSNNSNAMSKSRRRINSYIKNIILDRNGFFIYHSITRVHLSSDGVHLTPQGNDSFVRALATKLAQVL